MKIITKAALIGGFIGAVGILGKCDLRSAEVTEQIVLVTPAPIFESPAALQQLCHPLGCDATAEYRDANGKWHVRRYARTADDHR